MWFSKFGVDNFLSHQPHAQRLFLAVDGKWIYWVFLKTSFITYLNLKLALLLQERQLSPCET
jgi:hypothetical protein